MKGVPAPVPSPPSAVASPSVATAVPSDAPVDAWVALSSDALPAGVEEWATDASCGAVVSFRGTVRDHAEGRLGVEVLAYEAYESVALARMNELVVEARRRWPVLGRVALLHRVGTLALTDVAVLVVVAAPHRGEAFEAARWLIDALKATVPIWKRERWADGDDWGLGAQPLVDPSEVPSAAAVSPFAGPGSVSSVPDDRSVQP